MRQLKSGRALGLIDLSTFIVIMTVIYFTLCVFDMMRNPAFTKIDSIVVEQGYNTGVIKTYLNGANVDTDTVVLKVKPGDTIHVDFLVDRRRSADVRVERIFESGAEREYHINTVRKTLTPGDLGFQKVGAEYKVPLFIREGCGAYVFSRNYYDYRYNILTFFKPVVHETPRIKVCVEETLKFPSYSFLYP